MPDENIVQLGPSSNELALDPIWTPWGATPRTWEQRVFYGLANYDAYKAPSEIAWFESRHGPCTMETVLRLANEYANTLRGSGSDFYWPEQEVGELEDEKGVDEKANNEDADNDEVVYTDDPYLNRVAAYHYDIAFVLRMLGVGPDDLYAEQARTLLLQFLHAECLETFDRTLCALSLGHLRDERALPVLYAVLTGDFPYSQDDYVHSPQITHLNHVALRAGVYPGHWQHIPYLLWRWAPSGAVPALRRALDLWVQCERQAAHDRDYSGPDYWLFQNVLVYALGRLGAFDALSGIEPSDVFRKLAPRDESLHHVPRPEMLVDGERQRIHALVWRVQLCFAAVGYQYAPRGRIERFSLAPDLQRDVEHLLEVHFGMTSDQRNEALAAYEQEWLGGTSEEHYREWLWENATASQ